MTKPRPETIFEVDVCSRCGGTGNYSYNQIDGTRCYGCGGSGWKLTKRGSAARQWWLDTYCSVKASDVTIGMKINTGSTKFVVAEISEPFGGAASIVDGVRTEYLSICFRNADGRFGYQMSVDATVNVVPIGEARVASLEAAKAYQETLTLKGTPRK